MLFNSPVFLVAFLPITLLGLFTLARFRAHQWAVLWLVFADFVFYGWWKPPYVLLFGVSVLGNFTIARTIEILAKGNELGRARLFLILGITANLLLLGYFKYLGFCLDIVRDAFAVDPGFGDVYLPLAISFFTFQQIAFLADIYQRRTASGDLWHYSLFVSFFPQLIAGPIVRHEEVAGQITRVGVFRFDAARLADGLNIFLIGLFKKVCLGDGVAPYVETVFNAASNSEPITFFAAWSGVLGFTLQIYFDFSGYSDMAIGLGKMLGVDLPLNFYSPYKAVNIIDFWRRWHMTLSRFLRDYLYFPLGGNRRGEPRRYLNIIVTMLLGGLWHGANWTFIFWGGLHGLLVCLNHLWHGLRTWLGQDVNDPSWLGRVIGQVLTFLCVAIAWVFFRADSMASASKVIEGMVGVNGFVLPEKVLHLFPFLRGLVEGRELAPFLADGTVTGLIEMWGLMGLGLTVVFFAPNIYQLSAGLRLLVLVPTFAFTVQQVFFARNISEFLYFRF